MTAAVLGPSFRLEDAAEMIGETPTALLPTVEETISAGRECCVGRRRSAIGEPAGLSMLRLLYGVDIATFADAPCMRDMRGAGIRLPDPAGTGPDTGVLVQVPDLKMCGAGEPASLVDTGGRVGRRTFGDLLSRAEETWAGINPGARNGRMDSALPPGPLHRGEIRVWTRCSWVRAGHPGDGRDGIPDAYRLGIRTEAYAGETA